MFLETHKIEDMENPVVDIILKSTYRNEHGFPYIGMNFLPETVQEGHYLVVQVPGSDDFIGIPHSIISRVELRDEPATGDYTGYDGKPVC